jgi:multisubunit Na+/H+ antiporter MnhC subunit
MNLLFWIYVINATILINHEIDSAYWQEWKLLNPDNKNGINGFIILHIPMIMLILLGLILLYDQKLSGLIISLILSAGGIFAFFFHYYHLRKGRPEFNSVLSKSIIISTFVVSIFQAILTVYQIIK